ncbi:MAG TPA: hypothetical protein ENK46_05910 [Flavobacteriia bacterium]|jgi:hypothetical protein|nr:hypothetical protein [Flavobacteriia bacterium]
MINRKFLYFFILVISVFSCKKKAFSEKKNTLTIKDSVTIEDKKDIRSIGEILLPDAKNKIETWKEYQQLDELITNFYSISPDEALNLSKELSTLTQQLKDSVKIERFKQHDIGIRINVLNNSALRLADMATINAIDPTEVKAEIQNILDAFSALNSKINNITKQEKLEAELKTLQND